MSPSYVEYVDHYDRIESEGRYNWKYRGRLRESDKGVLSIIEETLGDRNVAALLDFGCGNGNLLAHLRAMRPAWTLAGRDMAARLIAACQADPELDGIAFSTADITRPPTEEAAFDAVISVAVLQVLDPGQHAAALDTVARLLKPGGVFINFDGYHDADEHAHVEVRIDPGPESTTTMPITYHYYSKSRVRAELELRGFTAVEFRDFFMPFDLERQPGNPASTHTVALADGRRFSMLGTVCQPWSFLIARM